MCVSVCMCICQYMCTHMHMYILNDRLRILSTWVYNPNYSPALEDRFWTQNLPCPQQRAASCISSHIHLLFFLLCLHRFLCSCNMSCSREADMSHQLPRVMWHPTLCPGSQTLVLVTLPCASVLWWLMMWGQSRLSFYSQLVPYQGSRCRIIGAVQSGFQLFTCVPFFINSMKCCFHGTDKRQNFKKFKELALALLVNLQLAT